VDYVFPGNDDVSSLVGRVYGLGTIGTRFEFNLPPLRPKPGTVLVVALQSPFSEIVRSNVGVPRNIRNQFLPPFRGYDHPHTASVPLPYDRFDRQHIYGPRLSAVRGVVGRIRGNIQANNLVVASTGVGSHQDNLGTDEARNPY